MTIDFTLIATIVGILLGLANTWVIFTIRSFHADVEHLRIADATLLEKISAMGNLLAGQYVPRTEFKEDMKDQTTQLVSAMDKVELRLTNALAAAVATTAATIRSKD